MRHPHIVSATNHAASTEYVHLTSACVTHALMYPLQVYYMDSFKFFLSLYGHKLPVLCLDVSSDGTLLATGSADKNIKV